MRPKTVIPIILALAGQATYATDTEEMLRADIRRLETRIATLEDALWGATLDQQRTDDIRALIIEVLSDAEQRAALLDHSLAAGHDGRFFIADGHGRFRLDVGGQIQVRYVYNRQSESPTDDHRSGFELRRTQLAFQGYAVDPRLRYKVQGGFERDTGIFRLLDAEVGWMITDDWFVRVGQFRPGFLREDSTSSTRQMAVERSLVNARFAQNRMQGIELRGIVSQDFRISGMVSDGLRSRNTPWHMPTVEYALTGRVEWLAAGEWDQFRQFTSPIGESPGFLLGGAIHWQRDEFGTADDNELEMLRWTVDGQLSLGGVSVFAAFIVSHENMHRGASHLRWGAIIQASAYVAEPWELFARYEFGDAAEDGQSRLSVITTGVNWYISGHRVKWTTDVGIGLRSVGSPWASSSAGWRPDAPGRNGQVVVRSQLQLLF